MLDCSKSPSRPSVCLFELSSSSVSLFASCRYFQVFVLLRCYWRKSSWFDECQWATHACISCMYLLEGPDKKWERWLSMFSVSMKLVLCTRAVTINWLELIIRDVAIRYEYMNMLTPVFNQIDAPFLSYELFLWSQYAICCQSIVSYEGNRKVSTASSPNALNSSLSNLKRIILKRLWILLRRHTKPGQKHGRL